MSDEAPAAQAPAAGFSFSARLWLRLLGASTIAAFASLWVQVDGLIGAGGILPATESLDLLRQFRGLSRFWEFPTILWLGGGDAALHVLCAAGTIAGLLLVAGRLPHLAIAAAWASWLSLVTVGRIFLAYQWDALLLEALALTLCLYPLRASRRWAPLPEPLPLGRFLLLWLVARLHVVSGLVKLASGDPTWRSLTALAHHFETQPLPTPLAWWAHRLPADATRGLTAVALAIEIAAPLLLFGPRRARLLGLGALAALQLGIAATGNYGIFNLLALSLLVLAVDDATWARLAARLRKRAVPAGGASSPLGPRGGAAVVALAVVLFTATQDAAALGWGRDGWARPWIPAMRALAPFHTLNSYGLFASMTTARNELVIEASLDGSVWRPYGFRWKPGDPERRPPIVAPHQPRLDWQMWFAALAPPHGAPWMDRLLERLLAADPAVLGLLAEAPFGTEPPRFVRVARYRYRFADPAARARGIWWERSFEGIWAGPRERPLRRALPELPAGSGAGAATPPPRD